MNVPILYRLACFVRQSNGTLRHLDHNIVNTTLGTMIEPRTLYRPGENVQLDDVHDSDYSDIQIVSKTDLAVYANTPLGSSQWPRKF